jgi:hypothetical protein
MVGTNLSVWFSVLIQETKHEILTFYDPENGTLRISHRLGKDAFISVSSFHLFIFAFQATKSSPTLTTPNTSG